MVEPLESQPILDKLIRRSREGRVAWEVRNRTSFFCSVEGQYTFEVSRYEDTYRLEMRDASNHEILSLSQPDRIVFQNDSERRLFESLSDLYEIARRKALQVEDKLATASELLDRI